VHGEQTFPEITIVLPVYQPGPPLADLVGDLLAAGAHATRVVIVDDGSGPDADPVLARAADHGCTVLRHPTNRGKGAAVKTGLGHAMTADPDHDVVCADADGQHRGDDIRRVASRAGHGRVILGVRRFDRMPARSRFGNTITRELFRAATGRRVSDTQTGLRAYPAGLLGQLCAVPGNGFEYEMNMLLAAAANSWPIDEIEVSATYLDDNKSTNFGSLSDSARVYWPLLRYATMSRLGTAHA
jgi:glycosyltransferase involved in cell wall biosynthesis